MKPKKEVNRTRDKLLNFFAVQDATDWNLEILRQEFEELKESPIAKSSNYRADVDTINEDLSILDSLIEGNRELVDRQTFNDAVDVAILVGSRFLALKSKMEAPEPGRPTEFRELWSYIVDLRRANPSLSNAKLVDDAIAKYTNFYQTKNIPIDRKNLLKNFRREVRRYSS